MRTLAKRTTGRRMAVPQKRCTTPRAPLTTPRPGATFRVSITCAPTFSSRLALLCAHRLDVSGCCFVIVVQKWDLYKKYYDLSQSFKRQDGSSRTVISSTLQLSEPLACHLSPLLPQAQSLHTGAWPCMLHGPDRQLYEQT